MKPYLLGLLVNILLFAHFGFVFAEDEAGNFEGVIPRETKGARWNCHHANPILVTEGEGDNATQWLVFRNYMGQEIGKFDAATQVGRQKAAKEREFILSFLGIGTKIKGGCVGLADIPIIIIKLIDLCTKLAGTIAVIFGLYAGYQMIMSGLTEDRESAKNTLKYAAIGLIVSLTAWIIVNLVQVQLTS